MEEEEDIIITRYVIRVIDMLQVLILKRVVTIHHLLHRHRVVLDPCLEEMDIIIKEEEQAAYLALLVSKWPNQ